MFNIFLYEIMLILNWTPIAKNIKENLTQYIIQKKMNNKYIAIFLLWDNKSSMVYVNMKKKFWNNIGLDVVVFGDSEIVDNYNRIIGQIKKLDLTKIENILKTINYLNDDETCIGIVVQLPIPDDLNKYKSKILSSIIPVKDIDWLGWSLIWKALIDYIDFLPATPASVINLLEFYELTDFKGKTVSVIGQSNLVGKPLAIELIKRYATVFSFNEFSNIGKIKEVCKESDYIISATWHVNMIDDEFVRDDKSQILIDVWYWFIDWKPVWDINFEKVKSMVKAISPVPWWVWPLTVASLFDNIRIINDQIDKLSVTV